VRKVIIFGTKDFAELAHYYISKESADSVAAFTVDRQFRQEDSFLGLPLVDFEDIENKFPPKEYVMFVPMSYAKMNAHRRDKLAAAKAKGYSIYSYISPRCTNYALSIGENAFIFEDNTLQPFTRIGANVILWSGNHIGHHSTIEDHVFVSSHVVISGHCRVGEASFLGVNSTVNNSVNIGKRNIIGSGAIITRDTGDDDVYKAARAELAAKKSFEIDL
jgi:sugar O-acyltransferase (sialic acid O-acetyltransferase NeuD family)